MAASLRVTMLEAFHGRVRREGLRRLVIRSGNGRSQTRVPEIGATIGTAGATDAAKG